MVIEDRDKVEKIGKGQRRPGKEGKTRMLVWERDGN